MTTVTREHLAGLELAKLALSGMYYPGSPAQLEIGKLIAQANASPEQEPSLWVNPNDLWRNGKQRQVIAYIEDNRENYTQGALPIPLYTRAEPSEVAQLRAELVESDACVVRALNERDAATRRAEAAERKLGEAVGLLRKISARGLTPTLTEYELDQIDAFLPANAEHAKGRDGEVQSHE